MFCLGPHGRRVGSWCGALASIVLVAHTGAVASSKLDAPHCGEFRVSDSQSRSDCSMFELFDQVARQSGIAIGFENLSSCWLGPRSVVQAGHSHVLHARTAREAFDEVVTINPSFRWAQIDGVVVVRPVAAWDDPADVLNQRAAAFQVINVDLHEALVRALDATTPPLRYPRATRAVRTRLFDPPMSVDFSGGTLLRALNAVVRGKGDAVWRVAYMHDEAAVLVAGLSTLDTAATTLVQSISWTPLTVTSRP